MKGHVVTPDGIARRMALRLFRDKTPVSGDRILYPGCGTAPFARAVEDVCKEHGWPLPEGIGVDRNPNLLAHARQRGLTHVAFEQHDFLNRDVHHGSFDFVVGNPPYVPIEGLDESEKQQYRATFKTATGRFDLYFLFFERALGLLKEGGILSFITPEKWEYVRSASSLRGLLSRKDVHVESIEHVAEDAFEGYVTYPSITTVRRQERGETQIRLRSGESHDVTLSRNGNSWASAIRGRGDAIEPTGITLADVAVRISAGVATGADSVFVTDRSEVPASIGDEWMRPTVSGRQLKKLDTPSTSSVFLCPYRDDGSLVPESDLGAFGKWAAQHRDRLESRSCVEKNGRPWYAWHENPPMTDLLRPKIIFRDIVKEPKFWIEDVGNVVPRHSVYYLIPQAQVNADRLCTYLNSQNARQWMRAHCQKAANGYMRLQSTVLKKLPVPEQVASSYQTTMSL